MASTVTNGDMSGATLLLVLASRPNPMPPTPTMNRQQQHRMMAAAAITHKTVLLLRLLFNVTSPMLRWRAAF